jgi:hypothetical protein
VRRLEAFLLKVLGASVGARQTIKERNMTRAYFDLYLFSLDSLSEKEQILHQGCKLGHVPYAVQQGRLGTVRWRIGGHHLRMTALPWSHGGGGTRGPGDEHNARGREKPSGAGREAGQGWRRDGWTAVHVNSQENRKMRSVGGVQAGGNDGQEGMGRGNDGVMMEFQTRKLPGGGREGCSVRDGT